MLVHILREIEKFQPRPLSPTPEEYYQKGKAADLNKDFVTARDYYQKAAAKNEPRAISNLGTFFRKGIGGCPADKLQAHRLFLEHVVC